jgi:hypothetical protein
MVVESMNHTPMQRCLYRLLPTILLVGIVACGEKVRFDDLENKRQRQSASQHWKELLEESITEDGIRYDHIDDNRDVLHRFLHWAGEHGPEMDHMRESKEDRRIAYVANTYNAAVIHSVLEYRDDQLSPDSGHNVMDVKAGLFTWRGAGFFFGKRYRSDGEWGSLWLIEEQSLVNRYQDPLLHFSIHKACVGCPPIQWWPGTGVQHRLETTLRAWLATEHGMRQTKTGWAVSALITDHEKDFMDWSEAESLCDWLHKYAPKPAKKWLRDNKEDCPIESFAMDWTLDDAVDP